MVAASRGREYLAELAEIKRVELASRVAPAPSRTAPSP